MSNDIVHFIVIHIVEEQKKQNVYLVNSHESVITAANQKVY